MSGTALAVLGDCVRRAKKGLFGSPDKKEKMKT
jgi:hypothetical protein